MPICKVVSLHLTEAMCRRSDALNLVEVVDGSQKGQVWAKGSSQKRDIACCPAAPCEVNVLRLLSGRREMTMHLHAFAD